MKNDPKIELHLHLEGAAPPAFIRQLAAEKKVDLSKVFDADGNYTYKDFWDFLAVYEAATSVLNSPDDFGRLTRAVLEESAANGVIYTELFLSPAFCGGGDVGAWVEYLAAMQEAAQTAERDLGIHTQGIVTVVRHFGTDKAKMAAACAQETAGDFITGFGMGGDEKFGRQGDYAYAFDMAREAGLQLTTHAGEWDGPQSVRDAIEDLNVVRVGHGVRAIEDPALIKDLIARDVVLEVCPGSNKALGLYPNLADHPIVRLRDAGVKVTVSTDDPPFFATTMTHEFEMLERTFGWGKSDFKAVNEAAVHAAFCDAKNKENLLTQLERWDD